MEWREVYKNINITVDLYMFKYIRPADSLRLLQHVETIRVPCSWKSLESKSWKDLTWEEKQFEVCNLYPTMIIGF